MNAMQLPSTTVHMAIDMQRVFAEETDWCLKGFHAIVPNIGAIAAALPGRTLFTRFVMPHTAEQAHGQWRNYYRRWKQFTREEWVSPGLCDIVDALAPYTTTENLIDKPTYSAFEVAGCALRLTALGADTIVFTGIETDVCVLATLMAAVDRGYRVIAVADALGSSSTAGHRATLDHVLPRMPDQVEIVGTDEILGALQSGRNSGVNY
jgi:nicotinamidase-related amidase